MNVILVHGIFDTGRIFKPMMRKLSAQGHRCFAPSLKPFDARHGVRDLAGKLKVYIEQHLAPDEAFVLVGFSMGCLVSRVYLQEMGGWRNCKMFHAISGPHQGSFWARFVWGQGARDMLPNSALLQDLQQSEQTLHGMPLYSYRTPYDIVIVPSESSHWEIAQNFQTAALLHQLMVSDRLVMDKISQSLEGINA